MKIIGLDVETTMKPNFKPWHDNAFLVNVGMVNKKGDHKIVMFKHNEISLKDPKEQASAVQEIIDKTDLIVAHNAKFDLQWLKSIGVDYSGCNIFCTQVAEYLLSGQSVNRGSLTLDAVSKKYGLDLKDDRIKAFWESGVDNPDIPLDILNPYLLQDCSNTMYLYKKQLPQIKERGLETLVDIQMKFLCILADMEYNGVKFDASIARQHADKFKLQIQDMEDELIKLFGFECNLSSNDDLSAALYGGYVKRPSDKYVINTKKVKVPESYVITLKSGKQKVKTRNVSLPMLYHKKVKDVVKIPIAGAGFQPPDKSEVKGKEGFYKTNKDILKKLPCKTKEQKRVKKLLLELSVIQKAYETLVGKDDGDKGLVNIISPDGLIHSSFNQTVTVTGRLSSSKPNSQNIPRSGTSPLKECFIPTNDYILDTDLSSAEWRVAGQLSNDDTILYETKCGISPHTDNAIKILGADPTDQQSKKFKDLRTLAKTITFRLLYGGSAYGFYFDSNMPSWSIKKWQTIVKQFFQKYKGLNKWHDETISHVYANGGWFQAPTGRWYKFNKDESGSYEKSRIKNYPVQGTTGGDIMPMVMGIIKHKVQKYNLKSRLILQVHDSLVWDAVDNETKDIYDISMHTFSHIPNYMKRVFNMDWQMPMSGEAKIGRSYGDMEDYYGS